MPTPPLLVAFALLAGGPAEVDDKALGQAYGEGQEHAERKAYPQAAESFERAFDMLPETEQTRAMRENLAVNVIDSYMNAYRVLVDDEGRHEYRHLENADRFRQRYIDELEQAYGTPAAGEMVRTTFGYLDRAIEEHYEQKVEPCLSPIVDVCLQPLPCLEPIEPKRGCGGTNDPLVAAALLLPLGLRRRDVFERIADTLPADVAARLKSKLDDGS